MILDDKNFFLNCELQQYNSGNIDTISDIISNEETYTFSYNCKYNETVFQDTKTILAFPSKVEELVIGHTILDCLPCYDANFTYEISSNDKHYTLNLIAKDSEIKENKEKVEVLPSEYLSTMGRFLEHSGLWEGTGCFHKAALFNPQTKELHFVEDIGRHNCVDRLKGYAVINNINLSDYFIFITARITASLYAKIRRAGFTTIVSHSAVTSNSYLRAKEEDVTLIAFCRPRANKANIYNI